MLVKLRENVRNLEEFNGRYKDKTAFILGAGPSLNLYDLTPLKDYVTITVNSAFIAAPWSDFFISDDFSTAQWSYFRRELRKTKTTVLLYEDKLKNQRKLFKERTVFFRHRRGYNLTAPYNHNSYDFHICQARTSVGSAIHVAYIMGCEKVVLIGIDCCRVRGKRYFWDDNPNYDKPTRLDGIVPDFFKKVREFDIDTDTDLLAIMRYWEESAQFFLEKIKVVNVSPVSVIHSFPRMSLEECINSGVKKNV